MNLHGIVRGAITSVNPDVPATLRRSTGTYTTAPDGKRTPGYVDTAGVMVQVQGLSAKDIQHMDALNIQGVLRSVHLNGDWQGVVRPLGQGGDLFRFSNPAGVMQWWLVVNVMETWPVWCRVIVALQTDMAVTSGTFWDGGATWDAATLWN